MLISLKYFKIPLATTMPQTQANCGQLHESLQFISLCFDPFHHLYNLLLFPTIIFVSSYEIQILQEHKCLPGYPVESS